MESRNCTQARPGAEISKGFTLLELMVALTIAGILLTLATPSLASLYRRNHLETNLSTLFTTLQFARTEAIKTKSRVRFCKSSDGKTCDKNLHWNQGWMVYTDINNNRRPDRDEPVVRVQDELKELIDINYGRRHELIFKPDGSVWPNGTFRFCDTQDEIAPRAIIVYQTGRIRISDRLSAGGKINC